MYFFCFFFIPFIVFALLFLSLLVVTQIRGHIAGFSPPLMGAPILETLMYVTWFDGKAQVVQTKMCSSGRNTAPNRQHEKPGEATAEIVIYLSEVRNAKGYNFSADSFCHEDCC